MLVGNPAVFAIESAISDVYPSPGQMGLGFFNIYVLGNRYGVREADATLLACSFNEVEARLTHRDRHRIPNLDLMSAQLIAEAYLAVRYVGGGQDEGFFGETGEAFERSLLDNKIIWAPDGDEAFDDGSHVLHLDQPPNIRLIAFTRDETDLSISRLSDLTMPSDEFYAVLSRWRSDFRAERDKRLREM